MSEDQQPPRKAVRRVVKKTVVRPVSQSAPAGKGVPATDRAPGAPAAAKVTVPTRRTPTSRSSPTSGSTAPAARVPVRDRGPSIPGRARALGRGVVGGVVGGARSGAAGVAGGVRAGGHWVAGLRLPVWPGPAGAVASGAVAGLVGSALGAAALELFSWWLGVRAGGGWGVVAFALVLLAAGWAGSLLLAGFGHASARLVASLGVLLGLVVLLITLPDAAETAWAFLVVPVLGAASFLASDALVRLAESSSGEES